MSWADALTNVHLTPSLDNFQRGQTSVKGPTLKCRQTCLLDEWEAQENISRPQDPTQSCCQHLCERDEILAQHNDELFEAAQDASHICDGSAYHDSRRHVSKSCALCSLISQLPAYKTNDNYGLYVLNILNEKERRVAIDYGPENFTMGLAVSEENRVRVKRRRLGRLPPPMEGIRREDLIIPAEKADGLPGGSLSPYHARVLDPTKADFISAKAWIQECSISHPACRRSVADLSGTIHVIDCASGRILLLPADAKYLTLSYVWGQQSRTGLSKKGSQEVLQNIANAIPKFSGSPPTSFEKSKSTKLSEVPANAPRTITDAIAVTLTLGYQYLWCDRYCTNQDDPVIRISQLSMMDKIYEAAVVTLVAASGVDDSYGLPGAGTLPLVPRDPQRQAWIGSYRVVPVGLDIQTTVKQSKWATRAWTHQEAILSARCLIFSSRQLQFLCKTTSRCETLPHLPKLSSYDLGREINISSIFGNGTAGQDDSVDITALKTFESLANELLRRDITYESDTLDAFRGILNRVEYASFFGVPLITREGRELSRVDASDLLESGGDITVMHNTEIATLEDSKRIIASSTLDLSKKRLQPNLFHGGTYQHYMYDEFPGPGEPIQPSPTLAFLYGLTWAQANGDKDDSANDNMTEVENRRRNDMPSWSWACLRRGPFRYHTDPAEVKELSGDVQLNIYNGILVWAQQKSHSPQLEWISIDDAWRQSTGKALLEFGRYIKLKTLVGNVESLIVTKPEFGHHEFRVTLCSLATEGQSDLRVHLDCVAEDIMDFRVGTHYDLGWKIALIFSTTYYNPNYEKAWSEGEPRRVYLILRSFEGAWRRLGIMFTNMYLTGHGKGVMSVLKWEDIVLC